MAVENKLALENSIDFFHSVQNLHKTERSMFCYFKERKMWQLHCKDIFEARPTRREMSQYVTKMMRQFREGISLRSDINRGQYVTKMIR